MRDTVYLAIHETRLFAHARAQLVYLLLRLLIGVFVVTAEQTHNDSTLSYAFRMIKGLLVIYHKFTNNVFVVVD